MLTRSGAKLLDFNIASRVGDPVKTVSGTPPYQPPDADLTRWDVSTDLFAVGVTLYELLCDGEHPYPQARPMGWTSNRRDPRQFRTDLTDAARRVPAPRLRQTERSLRFQTAAEMKAGARSRPSLAVTRTDDGALVVVDLSNLCRDRGTARAGSDGRPLVARPVRRRARDRVAIEFRSVMLVADRSLPPLLDADGRRRLRSLEQRRSCSSTAHSPTNGCSSSPSGPTPSRTRSSPRMDNFDDFRRIFPEIQGSTDRFIGWEPVADGTLGGALARHGSPHASPTVTQGGERASSRPVACIARASFAGRPRPSSGARIVTASSPSSGPIGSRNSPATTTTPTGSSARVASHPSRSGPNGPQQPS